MDYETRTLSEAERTVLQLLARQIVAVLELRQTVHRMEGEIAERVLFEQKQLEERQHLKAVNVRLGQASATDTVTDWLIVALSSSAWQKKSSACTACCIRWHS